MVRQYRVQWLDNRVCRTTAGPYRKLNPSMSALRVTHCRQPTYCPAHQRSSCRGTLRRPRSNTIMLSKKLICFVVRQKTETLSHNCTFR